ncbi:hypothetical protein ACFO5O_02490 [Geojedonia litorea]|uniref:Uncharacterized protein n=1 Tax=Geojedonia litorea TaxID=1268269 RepID=A0ABV9N1M7_9FLAO
MNRLCIYPKEVATITGKSLSSSRALIRLIKDAHGKSKRQLVTIKEFCDYEGLPYEEVFNMINKVPYAIEH